MITTGCEGCCFLKQDNKDMRCKLGQFCISEHNNLYAPGYCRFCRSHKWAKKQSKQSLSHLYDKILEERQLKFDMLVIFDEIRNNIDDLKRTIDGDWYSKYVNNIIIVDVTGFGERKNIPLKYIKSNNTINNIIVNSSVENELFRDRESTIQRISMMVKSQFFLSIPCGSVISNLDSLAYDIKNIGTRYIHWSFPYYIGNTVLCDSKLYHGLFVTKAYKSLINNSEQEQFTERLRKEEIETNLSLTALTQKCWMI